MQCESAALQLNSMPAEQTYAENGPAAAGSAQSPALGGSVPPEQTSGKSELGARRTLIGKASILDLKPYRKICLTVN